MPTRKEVSKLKADYILKREAVIKSKISLVQEQLYSQLIDIFIDQYKQDPTRVKERASIDTHLLIKRLEDKINKFGLDNHPDILREYIKAANTTGDLTQMYYATFYDDHTKLDEIKVKTTKVINRKLGIDEKGLVKNGFMSRMISDSTIRRKIITEARIAVANNYDLQTLKEKLKVIIVGGPESNGIIQQHYNTFAKDLLNSVSNNYSNMFAKDLDLDHAYYAGGLIKSSRALCLKNNGKIFTREQIENLKNDPEIIKMYGKNIADYDPFTLPGGYGCLHSWDWITPDLAIGHTREQNAAATKRNQAFKDRNNL